MSETVNVSRIDHEARHRALVEELVAGLRPVRRLWPTSLRLILWMALEATVLLFVIFHSGRTDLVRQLANPWYLLGIGSFAIAGLIGAAFALRSAVPGSEPSSIETGLLLVLAVASALLLLRQPLNGAIPLGKFIDQGLPCAFETMLLAAVPWLALVIAVRRGAPLSAGLDGGLVGAAAFLSAFALMRVNCPIDEGWHLFVWHFLPVVAGIGLSSGVGYLLFRRRIGR